MTIKSILKDFFTTSSNYAYAAFENARWGGAHEISKNFNSHIIPRMNNTFTYGLDKLSNFTQASRVFIATPVGKDEFQKSKI